MGHIPHAVHMNSNTICPFRKNWPGKSRFARVVKTHQYCERIKTTSETPKLTRQPLVAASLQAQRAPPIERPNEKKKYITPARKVPNQSKARSFILTLNSWLRGMDGRVYMQSGSRTPTMTGLT